MKKVGEGFGPHRLVSEIKLSCLSSKDYSAEATSPPARVPSALHVFPSMF